MRRALIVGIDNYDGAALQGCVNDANAMVEVLETHGNGSPNFKVRLMTSPGEEIARAKLREAIEGLFANECDIALLYFSGHGFIRSAEGYIVTSDFKTYDEGISMSEILAYANR